MPVPKSRCLPPLALLLAASVVLAQSPVPQPPGPRLAPPLLAGLQWRNIGPTTFSGRITDIEVARSRGRPDQVYVGTGSGGVFKSTNGGTSWTAIYDQMNGAMSIGDIAVAPSSPNIVWVGTGEANNPARDWGDGVYKSTDAGRTWVLMGLKDSRQIGRILVHPTNPDIVFVAAAGHMWGPHSERGLFKTTDGGRTWRKVLYVDENTGANDVKMDPANPQILFATTYQRQRKNYGAILNGPGSAVYRSTDGGETWAKLTRGFPAADKGRISLEIFPGDSKVIYADVEVSITGSVGGGPQSLDCAPPGTGRGGGLGGQGGGENAGEGGVYRSVDGGDSWEHVNSTAESPAGYFSQIWADPKDRNRVYRAGVSFHVSDDMGKTFRIAPTGLHADYHALWIDPDDPNHLIIGNDGGVAVSWDRTVSWTWRNNLPIIQFYEIDVDNRDPYLVCGGTQDNGSWCTPSAVRNRNGIGVADSWSVGGGDGFHVHIDPRDSTYLIAESQNGNLSRVSLASLRRQGIKPNMAPRPISCLDVAAAAPANPANPAPRPHRYRWEWNTPVAFSAHTPGVVYTGADVLFRSTDRGGSWKPISPDLTKKIDRDTIFVMGKALGAVNYSPNGSRVNDTTVTSIFGSVISIAESPVNARVLYVGTTDGQVQVTRDLGATWTNVSAGISGVPAFTYISTVLASRFAAGRVYVTFDGRGNADDRPYVYMSEDYGGTWRAITSGLPMAPITRIAEHPTSSHLLVVGHSRGVHFSNDGGANWQSLNTNMPTVPVGGLVFQQRDNALVVGTYGRGIWILDDVGPLQALTPEGVQRDALFISATRGRQWNLYARGATYGDDELYLPNPAFDPVISYYLRDGASRPVSITISDARGVRIRTLQGQAVRGVNRVMWDMRMDSALPTDDASAGGGRSGGGGGRGGGTSAAAGPTVLPGTYTVAIAVPGIAQPLRGTMTVDGDPTDNFSAADQRTRQDALLTLYNLQKTLVVTRAAARTLAAQGDSIKMDLARGGAAVVASRADSIADRMVRVQAESDRLLTIASATLRAIEGFGSVPTADQRQLMSWVATDAMRTVAALNRVSQTDIPALYAQHARGTKPRTVPAVALPAVAVPRGR